MSIYKAISSVMSEVGAIGKTETNKQQGFKYRGIDSVMNALQPLMIKYKIFVAPTIIEHTREERTTKSGANLIYSIMTISYRFYAEDGTFIDAVVIGEGMDSGDKASNKAMSVAFKYACFQVFCIPTEEMHDPDGETPDMSTPKNKPQNKPETKTISEAQAKRMFALADGNFDLVRDVLESYSYKSSLEVFAHDYNEICKKIEENAKGAA